MEKFFASLLEGIFESSSISSDWLTFSNGDLSIVKNIWAYVGIFGMGLTLVYFLLEVNSKFALEGAQNMTLKSFMAPFLKLMIACVILLNGYHLASAMLRLNNVMVDWADTQMMVDDSETPTTAPTTPSGSTSTTTTTVVPDSQKGVYDGILEKFKSFGIIEKIVVIIVTLLMWIVATLLGMVWVYKAFMYKLEFIWRISITPLGLSDVYSGNHSNAIRWLKGFLGLSLYAVAIIALPRLSMLLAFNTGTFDNNADLWDLLKLLGNTLIAPFAAIGVASTIKQACKEALG